jgi:hypothetical protein
MTRKLGTLLLILVTPLLVADTCGGPDCSTVEVLSIGTFAFARNAPCAGKSEHQIIAWYTQGGVKYPLRCGRTGRGGYGYLHIIQDPADAGSVGHGDPINDASFSAEIATTLAHGAEGFVGGGTWRYTREYSTDGKLCTDAWGFRVVLAKQPPQPDGHPVGIITAFRYATTPALYP